MDERKLQGLILEFDAETEAKMRSINDALDQLGMFGTQTRNVPHHITLGICERNPDIEGETARQMKEAGRRFDAFPIRFQHIGLFGLKVIFLAPAVDWTLLEMRRHFDPCEDPNWAAHATILIDERENILRALPIVVEMTERIGRMEGRVERIGFYEFFPPKLIRMEHLK